MSHEGMSRIAGLSPEDLFLNFDADEIPKVGNGCETLIKIPTGKPSFWRCESESEILKIVIHLLTKE